MVASRPSAGLARRHPSWCARANSERGGGEHHRIDLAPLLTHRFSLDQIEEAYRLFSHQEDGVLKVAITP